MKNLSKKYSWVFEGFACIFVLALLTYILFDTRAILFIVGTVFILFGLVRIIPLIRTTKDTLMKWLYLVEIIIDIAIGVFIIYQGTKEGSMGKTVGYLIGSVLYLRGFLYFFGTVMRKEYTEKMQFVMGVVMISVGSFIIGMGNITVQSLSWVIVIIAIAAILFLGFNTFNGYKNYRNEYVVKRETQNVEIKAEEGKDAPADDKIITDEIIDEKPTEEIADEKPTDEINA